MAKLIILLLLNYVDLKIIIYCYCIVLNIIIYIDVGLFFIFYNTFSSIFLKNIIGLNRDNDDDNNIVSNVLATFDDYFQDYNIVLIEHYFYKFATECLENFIKLYIKSFFISSSFKNLKNNIINDEFEVKMESDICEIKSFFEQYLRSRKRFIDNAILLADCVLEFVREDCK